MNLLLELLIFGVCAIILWNVLKRLITDGVAAGIKQAADEAQKKERGER